MVGCSLVIARHGTPRLPHLAFRLGFERKKSRTLKKTVDHYTLRLRQDRSGATEIGGLVVLPRFRRSAERIGRQLSYARFAYLAAHPGLFRRKVLVEYLPKLDPLKGNELWKALGEKFTRMSYHGADRLSAGNKEFILSLFPKEKIYCCLLPEGVMSGLGVPGKGAEASLRMLERIGFRFLKQIDPFDGGPHYGADVADIPVVRKTRVFRFKGIAVPAGKRRLGLAEGRGGVRAAAVPVRTRGGSVWLARPHAGLLRLRRDGRVYVAPFEDARP